MKRIKIVENSTLAKLAAKKLKAQQSAVVIGETIYLYGIIKADFLLNRSWLLHELKHVEQYEKKGKVLFLFKYMIYSIAYGYKNNPYEVEAREAEAEEALFSKFDIEPE